MKLIHLANTEFERSLVERGMTLNRFERWLRFLPCAYAEADEGVWVVEQPEAEYFESLKRLGAPFRKENLVFEARGVVEAWAALPENLTYLISKEWVAPFAPPEAELQLIRSSDELERWLEGLKAPGLLRKPFALSGRGHRVVQPGESIPFEGPLVATRLLKRILDFSSQWKVGEEVELLGVTELINTPHFNYLGSRVGVETPFLEPHLEVAKRVLTLAREQGYRGHAGVDAFVFETEEGPKLYPIVEINFRKTLAWFLLEMKKRYGAEEIRFGNAFPNAYPILPTFNAKRQLFLGRKENFN